MVTAREALVLIWRAHSVYQSYYGAF